MTHEGCRMIARVHASLTHIPLVPNRNHLDIRLGCLSQGDAASSTTKNGGMGLYPRSGDSPAGLENCPNDSPWERIIPPSKILHVPDVAQHLS